MFNSYDSEADDFFACSKIPLDNSEEEFFTENTITRRTTKICQFYLEGNCIFKENCFYQHPEKESKNWKKEKLEFIKKSVHDSTKSQNNTHKPPKKINTNKTRYEFDNEATMKNRKYQKKKIFNPFKSAKIKPNFKLYKRFDVNLKQQSKIFRDHALQKRKERRSDLKKSRKSRFSSKDKLSYFEKTDLILDSYSFEKFFLKLLKKESKLSRNIRKSSLCQLEDTFKPPFENGNFTILHSNSSSKSISSEDGRAHCESVKHSLESSECSFY